MTLPASGGMTGAAIRSELRQSGGNIVNNDATQRWLTGKAAGSIIWPTDYYSKQAVKSLGRTNVGGGSVFSNNINLGTAFPNRSVIIIVGAVGGASQNLSVTNFTADGTTVEFIDQRNALNGTRSMSTAIGIIPASVAGTSALVNLNLAGSATLVTYALYQISNRGTPGTKNNNGTASGSATALNVNAGVPVANGFFMVSAMKAACTGMSIGGATELFDADQGDTIRWGVGISNRMAFEASRNGSFSGDGSADLCLISVAGFG